MNEFLNIFFMAMMGLTSVVGLTVIVERAIVLRRRAVIPRAVEDAVERFRGEEDLPAIRMICDQNDSPTARLLKVAESRLDLTKEENENTVQTRARQEVLRLERGLVVLEIVVGIAPLMGLVGTIFGMMTLFGSLEANGQGDAGHLAEGISYILRFTMMGLLIAIPSLIAWSYFTKKVESLAVEMEGVVAE